MQAERRKPDLLQVCQRMQNDPREQVEERNNQIQQAEPIIRRFAMTQNERGQNEIDEGNDGGHGENRINYQQPCSPGRVGWPCLAAYRAGGTGDWQSTPRRVGRGDLADRF